MAVQCRIIYGPWSLLCCCHHHQPASLHVFVCLRVRFLVSLSLSFTVFVRFLPHWSLDDCCIQRRPNLDRVKHVLLLTDRLQKSSSHNMSHEIHLLFFVSLSLFTSFSFPPSSIDPLILLLYLLLVCFSHTHSLFYYVFALLYMFHLHYHH